MVEAHYPDSPGVCPVTLDELIDAYAEKVVAEAPPMTEQQKAIIATVLKSAR